MYVRSGFYLLRLIHTHSLSFSLSLSSVCVPALKHSRGLRFAKLIA